MNTNESCYGTKLVSNPTMLDDIMQTLTVREKFSYRHNDELPFSYSNVANILYSKLVRMPINPKVYERDQYCSLYEGYTDKDFMFTFDLQLHDAAVSYTYLAQETGNKEFANIACDLWFYSRQLRVHHSEEVFKNYGRKQILDGIGVSFHDILTIVYNTIRVRFWDVGYHFRRMQRKVKSLVAR